LCATIAELTVRSKLYATSSNDFWVDFVCARPAMILPSNIMAPKTFSMDPPLGG